MILQNKNILLISPEPWDHIFVSKHHYATHLAARGNKVFFLNPPIDKNKIEQTTYTNVWSVHYKGFPKGMRFYPSFLQRLITRSKYKHLQKICDTNFDIVWSFDNSVFYNFEALPESVFCISHIVDLNQDFQTQKAASSANICIGVIPPLVERLSRFNPNTHLITHGVQVFPIDNDKIELPGQNKVKALYAGNMLMPHIDWEELFSIASNNLNVDFIFVGPHWEVNNDTFKILLQKLSNVYSLGSVPASQLPAHLMSASILLLAYTQKYSTSYASPHKMMEYLASGTPIVSTFLKDYSLLYQEGLIALVDSNSKLNQQFSDVLNNLSYWASEDKRAARKEFCKEHSYARKIQYIESILQ